SRTEADDRGGRLLPGDGHLDARQHPRPAGCLRSNGANYLRPPLTWPARFELRQTAGRLFQIDLITRAGSPTATLRGGRPGVTPLRAPTTLCAPILPPRNTIPREPSHTFSSRMIGAEGGTS